MAGYILAQRVPVRYQADAVLILSEPGNPSVLGGGDTLNSSDRQVYLAKQADLMTSSIVLERALELLGSGQSPRDVRDELDVRPSENMANISIVATSADPPSAAALANAVGTAYEQFTENARPRTRNGRSPASSGSGTATRRTSTPVPSPRTAG